MEHESHERFDAVWVTLERLRADLQHLERTELERVAHLRGHQTVDDLEALQQSFVRLDQAVLDIEQTLASLGEATGEIGKL
ncbi:hypothetical protein GIV19_03130 [Pseudomonas syringae]|uniref:hypothetical protein n=1 Tax=Pseudomonas syringae TaxID=317 RepID=UPI001F40C589|nr:hypothetical protein [Pseudomonas syringae]MCF5706279.1 hypothetical protein [Pseudomonas syringae]